MMPAMRASAAPLGTPRVDDRLHVTFVQMGGTIDKDYPRMMGGYAFEITDPAVQRILKVTPQSPAHAPRRFTPTAHAPPLLSVSTRSLARSRCLFGSDGRRMTIVLRGWQVVPAAFTFDVVTVCRKDSQELQVEDRQSLVEMIRRIDSTAFIVTHGTDTMIETAQYVAAAQGRLNKTVIFTGAMRPQKMVDSDASFNIGAAVGALNILGAGVYVCMNGRVYESGSVRRDGRTGHFVPL